MELLRAFRFRVELRRSPEGQAGQAAAGGGSSGHSLGDGGFQEVSGLELEMDVQELQEGGRNDGVIQRPGRVKLQPLVLKRGMFLSQAGKLNRELWQWLQGAVAGQRPLQRYDGRVEVLGRGEDVLATWTFDRGLPLRLRGPQLDARSGEIALEELHIAHEGLRLEEI